MAYSTQPAYPGGPVPKRAGSKGCVIALAIVGALALVAVIALAIGLYVIAQNQEVRKIASAVGEGMDIMKEAQRAPGTGELRRLGCEQAMVLDMQRLARLADDLQDGGTPIPPDMPGKLVMCLVAEPSSAPSCDAVAKTYLAAVPKPAKRVAVTVEAQKSSRARCAELYDPAGAHLGPFDMSAAPPIPSSRP